MAGMNSRLAKRYFRATARPGTDNFSRAIHCLGLMGILLLAAAFASAQGATEAQRKALRQFAEDPALKYAGWGFVVQEAGTGKLLVEAQGNLGLPAASTQKIFTSIAGYDILGKTYRYETRISVAGEITGGLLNGSLEISGSGDPSLGSFRFSATRPELLLRQITEALAGAGIKGIGRQVKVAPRRWDDAIPDGWIWQDIGNYYGAGAYLFNWRENQFDLRLRSGAQTGSAVAISETDPPLAGVQLVSAVSAAPAGSGDNAFIYLPPGAVTGVVRGTIPVNEKAFTISGALPDPAKQFAEELLSLLPQKPAGKDDTPALQPAKRSLLWRHQSPVYDTLNYWFLRKSINLYGEAFLKTIGEKKRQEGSTTAGVAALKEYWQERGIDSNALQIIDGSGLSPQNRVTALALAGALQYAWKQPWFSSFYQALPVYNAMKLKSGSITGARAFAGYHEAANGKKYVIAIVVSNYSCSPKQVVQKIFTLLNHWK